MKKLKIERHGEVVEVFAEKIGGKLWFHYKGDTFQYAPVSSHSSAAGGTSHLDPTKITAPMPGKVIKILKSTGDSVAEGDTVVVMEAMKMEYNLKATADLAVTAVLCKENESVSHGATLIELEKSNG